MAAFGRRHGLASKNGHSHARKSIFVWSFLIGIFALFFLAYRHVDIKKFIIHTYGVHSLKNTFLQESDVDTVVETQKYVESPVALQKSISEDVDENKETTAGDTTESETQDDASTSAGEQSDQDTAASMEHMSWLLWNKSMNHEFVERCKPRDFVMKAPEINGMHGLLHVFTSESERSMVRNDIQRADTAVTIDGVPCTTKEGPVCCKNTFWFRFGSTDVHVFDQVIHQHFLKLLYPFSQDRFAGEIRYILDAGGNCGLSTYILKALFPKAKIISLEPDPENFKILSKNTQDLQDVHKLNAGLWNETTKIKLTGNHGDWGRVFRKVPDSDKDGMLAYSVQDLLEKFEIPRFDIIKMDIEGSESVVLSPESDTPWLQNVKILFMEIHDFFAEYFGLSSKDKDVTRIVQDATSKHPELLMFSDNEHTIYVQRQFVEQVLDM